jgi:hypothetical protein
MNAGATNDIGRTWVRIAEESEIRVRMNPFSDVPSLTRVFSVPWGVKMISETVHTCPRTFTEITRDREMSNQNCDDDSPMLCR